MTELKKDLINPVEIVEKKELIDPVEIVDKKELDHEKQIYLLLYISNDDKTKSYEVIRGRTKIYEHIKKLVENIDCVKSKVIANGVDFKEALSVYYFMKIMETHFTDGFDIEEFVGDSSEEDNIGVDIDLE